MDNDLNYQYILQLFRYKVGKCRTTFAIELGSFGRSWSATEAKTPKLEYIFPAMEIVFSFCVHGVTKNPVLRKFKHSFLKHCFINIQILQLASETMTFYVVHPTVNHSIVCVTVCYLFTVAYEAGGGEGGRLPGLKNSGQTLFSGKAQVAQKFWKIKNISIQWKISGQILFFRASAGYSKFWMIKNIYSIQWIQGTLCFSGQARVAQKSWKIKNISTQWKVSGHTLLFRASTSCSKIPNVKTIFNTVKNFRETSVFRASASCSSILNVESILNTVKNFMTNSVFRASAKFLKNPES